MRNSLNAVGLRSLQSAIMDEGFPPFMAKSLDLKLETSVGFRGDNLQLLRERNKLVTDDLQAALESTGDAATILPGNQREFQQLRSRTKWIAFAIFALSTFTDALLTTHLLRLEGIAEANPIMVFAMRELPGGMFSVKAAVLLAIVVFWRKCSDSLLLLVALGMTVISFWNSLLVALSF